MYGLLLMVLVLDGLFMSVVILLQSGKGGGLAAMGGAGGTAADNLIGSRQAATLLTKATWISGGLFIVLSFVLAIMSTRARQPQSILGDEFQATPTAPTPLPVGGGAGGADLPGAGGAGGAGGDTGGAGGDAGSGGTDAGGGDAGGGDPGGTGAGGGGSTLDGPGARP